MVQKQLLNEYVRQPDNDNSLSHYTLMSLMPDYTTLGAHIVIHAVYCAVVHEELYQNLADKMLMANKEIIAGVKEEMGLRVNLNFGTF